MITINKTKLLLFITFLLCKVLQAQLTFPNSESIATTFTYDISLNKAVSEIKVDIKNNNKNYILSGFTLSKDSKKRVSLTGSIDAPFTYLIELASPITEIAMNELKEKVASIFCEVTLEALEKNKIAVSSKILSYKFKKNVNFNELHKQGLLMYAKNIKLNKSNYTTMMKKYLLRNLMIIFLYNFQCSIS